MNETIDKAIEAMAKKVASDIIGSSDALKFSQAALNLAHTKITLTAEKKDSEQ